MGLNNEPTNSGTCSPGERLARDELAHLERVHNRLYSPTEDKEIYNEKFAKLIVLETINCATHIEGIEAIKQHFGFKT